MLKERERERAGKNIPSKKIVNIPDKKVYVRRGHKYQKIKKKRPFFSFSVEIYNLFLLCWFLGLFFYTSRLFPLHERGFLLPKAVKTEMEFLRDFIFKILSQTENSPSSRKSTTLSLCLPVFCLLLWAYKDL